MDISNLCNTLRIITISSFEPFYEDYGSVLESIDASDQLVERWSFLLHAASLGILKLRLKIQKDEERMFYETTKAYGKYMPRYIQDFLHFAAKNLAKTDSSEINMNMIVGLWIIWNLGDNKPNSDVISLLAPTLGNYLVGIVDQAIESQHKPQKGNY